MLAVSDRFASFVSSSLLLAVFASLPAQEPRWQAPPLADQVVVRDGRTGERVALDALFDRAAKVDAVFVGETHLDETTHRVELAIYEALLAKKPGEVVLSLEMFERDVQAALDDYLAGRIDEPTFVERARPWGNYRTAYRRLIERAKQGGLPVVAANFPRLLRRGVRDGDDPFGALPERSRAFVPGRLLPNSPAYWRRVDNAVRGHLGMMGGPRDPADPRLTDMQSLWDNAMGEACALALDRHPGATVLHVCGGFHCAYWDGTARQFALRKPDAKLLTIEIAPLANPAAGRPRGLPEADFVVYAEARANDLDEGMHSVVAARELRYRLHVPAKASDAARVPLLIWLGDDGLTSQDGMDLWRPRLGDGVAIAVLEAPYRERGVDLGESGRWFWADTFRQDIGVLVDAVERTWGYLLRNQPIDPARVALAGEGSGATAVAAATMLSDRLGCVGVALDPRQYAKIKDFPLPLPELRGTEPAPDKRLVVLGSERDRQWWGGELDEYTAIGLENEFRVRGDDPWQRWADTEGAVTAALGLPAPSATAGERSHVVVAADTPRARHWARLVALGAAAPGGRVAVLRPGVDAGDSQSIPTDVRAADFASGKRSLPLCPGPFGGTTVLVLGRDLPAAEQAAWLELERNDPIARQSRFHRLRVATVSGEHTLPAVLAELEAQKRTNVLIVPAAFCADGAVMRALYESAGEADAMTLHWLPGLGAGARD